MKNHIGLIEKLESIWSMITVANYRQTTCLLLVFGDVTSTADNLRISKPESSVVIQTYSHQIIYQFVEGNQRNRP